MRTDRNDDSICTCEGGVWFYAKNVAEIADTTPDVILDWIEDNSNDIAEYVNDCIVDTAIEKTAELFLAENT